MAKSCCEPSRDARINQYQLEKWHVNETELRTFKEDDRLYSTLYIEKERDSVHLLVDPAYPNWMSVNRTGLEIMKLCDGKHTLSDIQRAFSEKYGAGNGKTEDISKEVSDFVSAAGTLEFISDSPSTR